MRRLEGGACAAGRRGVDRADADHLEATPRPLGIRILNPRTADGVAGGTSIEGDRTVRHARDEEHLDPIAAGRRRFHLVQEIRTGAEHAPADIRCHRPTEERGEVDPMQATPHPDQRVEIVSILGRDDAWAERELADDPPSGRTAMHPGGVLELHRDLPTTAQIAARPRHALEEKLTRYDVACPAAHDDALSLVAASLHRQRRAGLREGAQTRPPPRVGLGSPHASVDAEVRDGPSRTDVDRVKLDRPRRVDGTARGSRG